MLYEKSKCDGENMERPQLWGGENMEFLGLDEEDESWVAMFIKNKLIYRFLILAVETFNCHVSLIY
jgi:hypothetical protein